MPILCMITGTHYIIQVVLNPKFRKRISTFMAWFPLAKTLSIKALSSAQRLEMESNPLTCNGQKHTHVHTKGARFISRTSDVTNAVTSTPRHWLRFMHLEKPFDLEKKMQIFPSERDSSSGQSTNRIVCNNSWLYTPAIQETLVHYCI